MSELSPLTAAEFASYEAAIGRSRTETCRLDGEVARRFASTLGDGAFDDAAHLPLGRQWGFFLPHATKAITGADGHPKRGGFVPAVRLERRMFASGSMERTGTLRLDADANRTATIENVYKKDGAAGELVFVETVSTFDQGAGPVMKERQTIVFLNPGAAQASPEAGGSPPTGDVVESWTADEVDLFRFSAVTFNGHRIHYDRRYTTEVEGYPDLVVHGPLIASKLLDLAMRTKGADATRFSFRARMPAFVNQPLSLVATANESGLALQAVRIDGKAAMTAEAAFD